jgi:hypothetical protein
MCKIAKNENFENFGPLIGHGPRWINVTILTLISENNRHFKCPYKIWSKFISLDIFFKRKLKTSHRFYGEKGEYGVLKMSPYVSNRVP